MTDPAAAAPPPPQQAPLLGAQPNSLADDRQTALICYVLMLVPIAPLITHVVALVIAYVSRPTAPDWLKSHYTMIINTFWIGMLYFVCAGILCLLLIGFVLLPLVLIWFIVRCALGLSRLMRGEAYPTPASWTF
jgi:uncharacterized membrane protein